MSSSGFKGLIKISAGKFSSGSLGKSGKVNFLPPTLISTGDFMPKVSVVETSSKLFFLMNKKNAGFDYSTAKAYIAPSLKSPYVSNWYSRAKVVPSEDKNAYYNEETDRKCHLFQLFLAHIFLSFVYSKPRRLQKQYTQ